MNKKLIFLSGILVLCLFLGGCGAKLSDGKEAVVSFKDEQGISADDFYQMLKEKYGADEIIDLIDETLLAKEYEKTTEEDVYVNQNLETIKEQAGDDYENYIRQYYNVEDENELKDMLRLSYKRNLWIEDYVKSTITDDEVDTYYNEKTVGDMELSHILITPDVSEDASDEEKEKAEQAAKEKAESIIKELDNGADFAELAKKYSEDDSNKDSGGELGYINRDGYDENFIEGAIPLKKGEYTKSPVKSAYGYHIIKKTNQKSKPKKSEVEDDIKQTIAEEKLNSDSTLSLKALEALREKYNMKINDSELNKAYDDAIDELYSQVNSNSTESTEQ